MALEEGDREDLLREATALVERAEVQLHSTAEHVVFGFRRNGAWSVFFGTAPVYQFNSAGELRRAYRANLLYKVEQPALVSLQRSNIGGRLQFLQQRLNQAETDAFVGEMNDRLTRLHEALAADQFELIGQHPLDTNVIARSRTLLSQITTLPRLAQLPNAT